MIVLTGTSGGLAGVVLDTILDKKLLPPSSFRISSSSNTISARAKEAGIEVRYGDMTKPETLLQSFADAEALFLVSYPSVGEERYNLHRNAIDAAKAAGVQHVIYTSLTFGGPTGNQTIAGVMKAHVETVRYLKASGLSWTIVRQATYAHLWNLFAGFLQLEGNGDCDVVIPYGGPNSWASRNDLGEATAVIVSRWHDYVGQTVNLTGPRLLNVEEIIELYSKYTGRHVNVRVVEATKAIEYHRVHKTLPPEQEEFLPNWASWYDAMASGETDYLDPTLEQLLGRKPQDIQDMEAALFMGKTNILDTKDFV